MPEKAYPSPEEAALAEWAGMPQSEARVISVEYLDVDRAVVVTDTVPSHPMWNCFLRTPEGWVFTHDHN